MKGNGSNPDDLAERMVTPEQGSQKIYPPAVSHYSMKDRTTVHESDRDWLVSEKERS